MGKEIHSASRKAYQTVLADLRKVPLFQGHYDAKNGNPSFMYGIHTVIEFIEDGAGCDPDSDDGFMTNMIASDNMVASEGGEEESEDS